MRLDKGFSLVSLLVGVATSSVLLLTIAQLTAMSRMNFFKNEKTVEFYVNARDAIGVLRQYVPMAGVGIAQPTSSEMVPIQYSTNVAYNPNYAAGGAPTLPDWVYVGYNSNIIPIPNGVATPFAVNSVGSTAPDGTTSMPYYCAGRAATMLPTGNFMALRTTFCYFSTNPGWPSASFSTYNRGLCCANINNTVSDCAAPVYSCGASDGAPSPNWSAPVYQRLMQHLTVSTNTANGGDDILQVNFINTGPQLMTSYGGGSIPIDANKPPDPTRVNNYIFQVNNRNLQLIEQISNSSPNTYTIAQNIERMYVLVGESDRVLTQIVTGTQSTQLPEMNRYVRFSSSNLYTTSYASGTANLYPYRINAVRIALVVSSQDGLTPTAAATSMNVMRANDGTFITYTPASADRRLRKVFITTIYLNSYGLPEYRMHCALNSSGTNYQLKTGGIPFAPMTTNDLCCSNNNYTSSPGSCTAQSFALCEQQRMTGGC